MAYLSPLEVARLHIWGLRPEMVGKLTQLMAEVERRLGLKTYVRDYGGWRPDGTQEQLVEWRNEADAKDGIIGGGRDFYAVAPAGKSYHRWGAAVDLAIVDPSKRTDATYRAIADISRELGLVAGYYFTKKDEFHHELKESLAVAETKWRQMMTNRIALLAIVLLVAGAFFFPASSALALEVIHA